LAIKIFNKGTKKKQQRMLHKIQSLNCYSGKKYSIYFQINANMQLDDRQNQRRRQRARYHAIVTRACSLATNQWPTQPAVADHGWCIA